jgi:hypothetical protein
MVFEIDTSGMESCGEFLLKLPADDALESFQKLDGLVGTLLPQVLVGISHGLRLTVGSLAKFGVKSSLLKALATCHFLTSLPPLWNNRKLRFFCSMTGSLRVRQLSERACF